MKALHLLLVVLFTFSLCLSVESGDVLAATAKEKKEVTVPIDKAGTSAQVPPDEKGTTAKAPKAIPKDVNINTADKETLTLLPGIGPVTAEAILAYRQANGGFKSIEELTKVKGIGEKSLAKLKPYLQLL
jgi:competence protein ComEA